MRFPSATALAQSWRSALPRFLLVRATALGKVQTAGGIEDPSLSSALASAEELLRDMGKEACSPIGVQDLYSWLEWTSRKFSAIDYAVYACVRAGEPKNASLLGDLARISEELICLRDEARRLASALIGAPAQGVA